MFNLLKNLPKNFVNSPFAHRGYHDCNGSFKEGKGPENSRRSIIHAIKNGLGVEIDIRFTKDYVPVVIHDDYLKRLCGIDEYNVDEVLDLAKEEHGSKLLYKMEYLR